MVAPICYSCTTLTIFMLHLLTPTVCCVLPTSTLVILGILSTLLFRSHVSDPRQRSTTMCRPWWSSPTTTNLEINYICTWKPSHNDIRDELNLWSCILCHKSNQLMFLQNHYGSNTSMMIHSHHNWQGQLRPKLTWHMMWHPSLWVSSPIWM
jgi:hypothetical protein